MNSLPGDCRFNDATKVQIAMKAIRDAATESRQRNGIVELFRIGWRPARQFRDDSILLGQIPDRRRELLVIERLIENHELSDVTTEEVLHPSVTPDDFP